ncbi:hypothetical protein [Salinibacterium sp. PAMC 21357]|uniref:hypothetical protein n=1 Tax=Salinibacterium sp. PAMC 21357 TaxID=1112215 RepID=UPI00028958ED|nr:hypothetical protein [Salinibacterium sp. PAMC 21357]
MSAITRTWIAFAAVGAGLIHVALVIGSPLALAIPLGLLGIVEFGWGVFAFTREQLPTPRAAIVVAVAPLVAWGLLVGAASSLQIPALASLMDVVPWGIAAIFQLFVATSISLQARRIREGRQRASTAPGAARYLTALMLGALAVSALTTPALAATEAGIYAQPHGEHDGSFTPQRDSPAGDVPEVVFDVPSHTGH